MNLLGNALKKSEGRFRSITTRENQGKMTASIVENAPDLFMLCDKDGKILFANHLDGGDSSIYEYIRDDAIEDVKKCISGVFSNSTESIYEVAGKGVLGEDNWYRWQIAPVKSNDKVESVVIVTTDITEYKHAKDEFIKIRGELEDLVKEKEDQLKKANRDIEGESSDSGQIGNNGVTSEDKISDIIAEHAKEIEEITNQMEKAMNESKTIAEELSLAREQIEEVRDGQTDELRRANERIEILTDERNQAKNENQRIEKELDDLVKERTSELEEAHEGLLSEITHFKEGAEEGYKTIESLNQQVEELGQELERANEMANKDGAVVKQVEEESKKTIKDLNIRIDELCVDLDIAKKKVEEEREQAQQFSENSSGTIEKSNNQIDELKAELEAANERTQQDEVKVKQIEEERNATMGELNRSIEELKAELEDANEKTMQDEVKLKQIEEERSTTISELTSSIEELKATVEMGNEKLRDEEKRYTNLDEEFKDYQCAAQESKDKEITEFENQREELANLLKEKEASELELKDYKENIEDTMAQESAKLREENTYLKQKITDLEWSEDQFVQYRQEMESISDKRAKGKLDTNEDTQQEDPQISDNDGKTACDCKIGECSTKEEIQELTSENRRFQEELERGRKNQMMHNSNLEKLKFLTSLLTNDTENLEKTINNNLDMLQIGIYGNMNANQKGVIQRILQQSQDLRNMIGDAKKIIENERGASPKNVVDIVESIGLNVAEIKEAYKRDNIDFDIDLDASSRLVLANENLDDVFLHLLTNSVKFNIQSPKKIWIRSKCTKDGLKLIFEDNGTGVSNNIKARVNGKYQWTSGSNRTGLGLYIIKSVIEGFDGQVSMEDRVDGNPEMGTRFVFELQRPHVIEDIIPDEISEEKDQLNFTRVIKSERGLSQQYTKINDVYISDLKIEGIDETSLKQTFGDKLSRFLSMVKSLTLPVGDYRFNGRDVLPS